MNSKTTLLVMALCLLSTGWAIAQAPSDFNLDWFTVSCGDSSSGGDYTLTGGIGAAEAVPAAGGDFGMVAGFWSILPSLEIGELPVLRIAFVAQNSVLISWPAPSTGWVLEESTAPGASGWTDAAAPVISQGGDNTVRQPIPGGSRYYRLRHP
jgi:hypothetical protein